MDKRIEIRVALDESRLGIPYGPVKDAVGENFGYRSLIQDPDSIDQIPELFREPEMKEFIRGINAPGGTFETVRMLHWINGSEGKIQRSICFGFVFRDRGLFNVYSNCMMVLGNLLQFALKNEFCDGPALFEIQQAHFLQERCSGWIMDLYVGGIADTEEAARVRLNNHLGVLGAFLRSGG
ncbi:MAG: hypothetical protein QOI07_1896 [Verrucomicrobiota bacterium]|jgi:hypothetical protein